MRAIVPSAATCPTIASSARRTTRRRRRPRRARPVTPRSPRSTTRRVPSGAMRIRFPQPMSASHMAPSAARWTSVKLRSIRHAGNASGVVVATPSGLTCVIRRASPSAAPQRPVRAGPDRLDEIVERSEAGDVAGPVRAHQRAQERAEPRLPVRSERRGAVEPVLDRGRAEPAGGARPADRVAGAALDADPRAAVRTGDQRLDLAAQSDLRDVVARAGGASSAKVASATARLTV